VLVADDRWDVREALRLVLKSRGHVPALVDRPAAVLSAVAAAPFDVLLLDLNYTRDTTSGAEGLALLEELRRTHPDLPVVVMTAWGTVELAVGAMRLGARDVVLKPWDDTALVAALEGHARPKDAAASDLALAGRIQARFLPQARQVLRSLDYAAACAEARGVGGDAYDVLDLGPGRVGLVVADASGKGLPAALLVAYLQGCVRSQSGRGGAADLAALLAAVNADFHASTAPEHYATLFFGVYADEARTLRYVNCGHPPPLLLRSGGSVERLAPTATAVGLFGEWSAVEGETPLGPGDVLVAVSDGVTDAESAGGEPLGDERLLQVARRHAARPAEAVAEAVLAAVAAHAGAAADDDRTVLVARCQA
jgi:sigma-B regulation protein RsbU (phosphoserine phosphatase)